MTDVYIFGTNDYAYEIARDLSTRADEYQFLGLTLNGEYCTDDNYFGFPLVPFEDIANRGGDFGIINSLGYRKSSQARKAVADLIESKSIPLLTYIHKGAFIGVAVEIGEGCIIMSKAAIGNRAKLGKCNLVDSNSSIGHDMKAGNFNWFSAASLIGGNCTLGDYVYIGMNATVRDNVKIASYTTVGAGVYCPNDTVDYEILSPAKAVSIKIGRIVDLERINRKSDDNRKS